ncbi:hypothetical protein FB451DRAFT_1170452 [Mycena latifolia]|nr:hypothetical protein FB451DRAFT_1170452 [Mycena latifolia]
MPLKHYDERILEQGVAMKRLGIPPVQWSSRRRSDRRAYGSRVLQRNGPITRNQACSRKDAGDGPIEQQRAEGADAEMKDAQRTTNCTLSSLFARPIYTGLHSYQRGREALAENGCDAQKFEGMEKWRGELAFEASAQGIRNRRGDRRMCAEREEWGTVRTLRAPSASTGGACVQPHEVQACLQPRGRRTPPAVVRGLGHGPLCVHVCDVQKREVQACGRAVTARRIARALLLEAHAAACMPHERTDEYERRARGTSPEFPTTRTRRGSRRVS